MFKKSLKPSVIATISILLLFSSINVFASTNTRLSGQDRYETSSKIAISGWTQSDYAVLALGEDYPDALCATPLAGKYKAPILLTQRESIPSSTLSTIKQLSVKNVFIIGGTGVVSSNVETQLISLGITVTRLAGQDRYATAIEVAKQLGSVSQIAVVTGEDYADALSIAPIAVINNMPIILVAHDSIPAEVKDYISTQNITKTYVIGKGTSITNEGGLTNVTEINGSDKYERNIAIINAFKSNLDLSTVYLATGENFADSLSGSILAGRNSNAMILLGKDINLQQDFFGKNSAAISNVKILGGTGVVTDNVINKLTDLKTPIEIISISYNTDITNQLTGVGKTIL